MKFDVSHRLLLRIFLFNALNWFVFLHARTEHISSNYGKRGVRVGWMYLDEMSDAAKLYDELVNTSILKPKSKDLSTGSTESFIVDPFEGRQGYWEFTGACLDKENIIDVIAADNIVGYSLNNEHINLLRNYSPENPYNNRELSIASKKERVPDCTDSRYPTENGTCNNLNRTNEGSTFSRLHSLIPPDYKNRKNESSGVLPDPALVSKNIYIKEECVKNVSFHTSMVVVFGQFIEHDIEYVSISADSGDWVNHATAAIDGSNIYGSTTNEETKWVIRNSDGGSGKLHSNNTKAGEFPLGMNLRETCNPSFPCFLTGEHRTDYSLPLASLHITFFRMHNHIADKLKEVNPTWDDETLFQESRLINIFIIQNIVFREYLPLIVGQELMKEFQLDKNETDYNSCLPLGALNSFYATNAMIEGTLPDDVYVISELGLLSILPKNETYFDMEYIYKYGVEDIIRGATRQFRKSYPYLLKSEIKKHPHSSDLVVNAINVSRNFSLPGYVYYVFYLYGIRIKNFEDLAYYEFMSVSSVSKLEQLYKHVDDIELLTGLLYEKLSHRRMYPETFAIITSLQFRRLKYGNRFTYTHKEMLTPEQKEVVLNIKLSHVFCYVNKMPQIANNVFDIRSPIIRCDKVPPLNLSAWKKNTNATTTTINI